MSERTISWAIFDYYYYFFSHIQEKNRKTKLRRLLLCDLISIIDWNTQKVFLFFLLQLKYVATSHNVHVFLLFLFSLHRLLFPRTDFTKEYIEKKKRKSIDVTILCLLTGNRQLGLYESVRDRWMTTLGFFSSRLLC